MGAGGAQEQGDGYPPGEFIGWGLMAAFAAFQNDNMVTTKKPCKWVVFNEVEQRDGHGPGSRRSS